MYLTSSHRIFYDMLVKKEGTYGLFHVYDVLHVPDSHRLIGRQIDPANSGEEPVVLRLGGALGAPELLVDDL